MKYLSVTDDVKAWEKPVSLELLLNPDFDR